MASNNGYTPTEARIMAVLGDNRPHTKDEIRNVIDEMADDQLVARHISNLRTKLVAKARDIICRQREGSVYQLVYTMQDDE